MAETLLSIVIPTINLAVVRIALGSLAGLDHPGIEVIVVNQTGTPLGADLTAPIRSRLIELEVERMSAPAARNRATEAVSGRYVWFLDDDAAVFGPADWAERLVAALGRDPALLYLDRGHLEDGRFVSTLPGGRPGPANFSSFLIEWNVILPTKVLRGEGGFPRIGTGERHRAQSGECFPLFARLIARGLEPVGETAIKLAHPRLEITDPRKLAGYEYGCGYSVGMTARDRSIGCRYRAFWLLKCVAGGLRGAVRQLQRSGAAADRSRMAWTVAANRYAGLWMGICLRQPGIMKGQI